jgi:hypothetical protein
MTMKEGEIGWLQRRDGGRRTHVGLRYALSVLVVAAYAAFMVHKYGLRDGLSATYLTWSFFVLGTPVADAGGILDVPLRLLTGVPMVAIETCVVTFTLLSMAWFVKFRRGDFDRTPLLRAFRTMLTTPYPYWGLIALCITGTFLSVRLGDLLIDHVGAAWTTRAFVAMPTEFWVECAAYAVVIGVYVVGMKKLFAGGWGPDGPHPPAKV